VSKPAAKGGRPRPAPAPARPAARRARVRRVNLRALLFLGLAVALIVPGFFALQAFQTRREGSALLKQAEDQAKVGRVDLALKYLGRYVELNPGDAKALDRRAELMAEVARDPLHTQEAAAASDRVLRLDPDGPGRQATRRRLARLLLDMELYPNYPRSQVKYQTAEAVVKELFEVDKRQGVKPDAEAYRLQGRALQGQAVEGVDEGVDGKLNRAVTAYEKARELDPKDAETVERLAILYDQRLHKPAEAQAVLDGLVAADPGVPSWLVAHRVHSLADRPGPAAAALAEALKLAPDHFDARLAAARSALARNDLAEARGHLDALPEQAPQAPPKKTRNDNRARIIRGAIELQENQLDAAMEDWRQGLVQAGGSDADLSWWLAYVYLQLGRVSAADPLIVQYRRLVGASEDPPEYLYLLALRNLKLNLPAPAAESLETVRLKIGRNLEGQADFTLGQAYEALRDDGKAVEAYRRAARTSPRWSAPRLAAAKVLERAGDPAAAVAAAVAELAEGLAKSKSPDDPSLLVGLAQIRQREQLRRPTGDRDWSEVEALLAQAAAAAPDSPAVAMARAQLLADSKRLDKAVAILGEQARKTRKSADLWAALANGLSRLGRRDEAMKVLDEAAAPDAAGDQVALRIMRARLLTLAGRARDARAALVDDIGKLPDYQRPLAWKSVTELHLGQRDIEGARVAAAEWRKLAPHDPQPRLLILDLALAIDDDKAISEQVEALKTLDGGKENNIYWQVGRVHELLRDLRLTAKGGDTPERAAKVEEATRLAGAVVKGAPQQPAGYVLQGLLAEQQGQVDEAIAAYEKAVLQGGGTRLAVARVTALLANRGAPGDQERLRKVAGSTERADQFLAEVKVWAGEKEKARQIAEDVVRASPEDLQTRLWHARVLNSLGSPKEAEATLRELIRQQPGELGPWLALLFFQIGQQQDEAARATIERIRTDVKTDKPEFLLAQCYRAAKDNAKAEALYRESLRRWPDDPAVRRGAADFFEATGRGAEAEDSIRHVLEGDAGARWAARKLALMLSARPRDFPAWTEARSMVDPEAPGGDAPEDRLVRAVVYSRGPQVADRRRAIELLEGLVADLTSELPVTNTARALLVELLLQDGQAARAREHAARLAPNDPGSVALYAEALLRDGKPDQAEVQVDRLAALEPGAMRTLKLRARLLAARGRKAEAAAGLEKAFAALPEGAASEPAAAELVALLADLDLDEPAERMAAALAARWPKSGWVHARMLADRGDAAGAVEALRAALTAGAPPNPALAAFEVAISRADSDGLARAEAVLDEARSAAGAPSAVLDLLLAHLRHFQGDYEGEVKLYAEILERRPNDLLFLNNMAWTLSEELDRPAEALPYVEDALKRVGPAPQLYDTRGVIRTRLKDYPGAIADLKMAAEIQPSATVHFHLARAHKAAGDEAAARQSLELAKEAGLDPDKLTRRERGEWRELAGP